MAQTFAIILGAGRGERFGGDRQKQLAEAGGLPVVGWSIKRFGSHPAVAGIFLVVPPGEQAETKTALEGYGIERVDKIIGGGETRQESAWLGLQELPEEATHVLIHDAARPCFSEELLNRVVGALGESTAVIPAVPVVDTLIREESARVDAILDRVRVSGVQTPQGFEKETILLAHRRARASGYKSSDDGSLVLALGEPVTTVPGDRTNIKVTYTEDLALAEAILTRKK